MNQMEKAAVQKKKSDANSILDNLKDLIENLRNGKEANLQMGLQLQEQSTKASNSKSLLDTQIDASGSMVVDTLFDDLISIPSEEDPISTNEVGPGMLACGTSTKLVVFFCAVLLSSCTCLTKFFGFIYIYFLFCAFSLYNYRLMVTNITLFLSVIQ